MRHQDDNPIQKIREIAKQRMSMPLEYNGIPSTKAFAELVIEFCDYASSLEDENAVLKSCAALNVVGFDFTHRLAVMLECALLDKTRHWDEAMRTLDEYRAAVHAAAPQPETNIWGEAIGTSDLPSNAEITGRASGPG